MENNPLVTRVEAYFSALEAPLNELPAARRGEFLREARAHVQSMVEARRADGMDELAAWDSALANFGDPQEVGRALWREWASSGQLESEGAPLSKWDLVRRYLLRDGWSYGIAFLIPAAIVVGANWPYFGVILIFFGVILTLSLFGFLTWALVRYQRSGGKWTPSVVLSYGFTVLIILNGATFFIGAQSFRATPISHLSQQANSLLVFGLFVYQFFSYKLDLPKRPWRLSSFAARHKGSPVAAEQEYRFTYRLNFGIGIVSSGVLALSASFQLFGLAPTLFLGAAIIVVGLGLEIWRRK